MPTSLDRRDFVKAAGATGLGLALGSLTAPRALAYPDDKEPLYKISLAEWSLHRALFDKKLDHLDFSKVAKNEFGIEGVEYVNQFFKDKAKDTKYLADLKQRGDELGVTHVLIMIDGEGHLGDPNEAERKKAVENHHKWVDAAKFLGCHSIRVNAHAEGTFEEQQKLAADGLRQLSEYGASQGIGVIVENHGGLSSDGAWLAGVMKMVDHPNCGTLPDFGNFQVSEGKWYDRYKGTDEMMPFAKAVSAKSHNFDADGNCIETDYKKMMEIVLKHGYHGWVGIEYEGSKISEPDGIKATKKLLEKVRDELA
jgi:L-ribulose-5-phosphate 3-epimerase